MKSITFSAWGGQRIYEGQKTMTRRPIKADGSNLPERNPYGEIGDFVYIKEPWQAPAEFDHLKPGDIPKMQDGRLVTFNYPGSGHVWDSRKRHARYMPERAARSLVRIVDYMEADLHEIVSCDCFAEGCICPACGYSLKDYEAHCDHYICTREKGPEIIGTFRDLWDSIYGEGEFGKNPRVLVVAFMRVGL